MTPSAPSCTPHPQPSLTPLSGSQQKPRSDSCSMITSRPRTTNASVWFSEISRSTEYGIGPGGRPAYAGAGAGDMGGGSRYIIWYIKHLDCYTLTLFHKQITSGKKNTVSRSIILGSELRLFTQLTQYVYIIFKSNTWNYHRVKW